MRWTLTHVGEDSPANQRKSHLNIVALGWSTVMVLAMVKKNQMPLVLFVTASVIAFYTF